MTACTATDHTECTPGLCGDAAASMFDRRPTAVDLAPVVAHQWSVRYPDGFVDGARFTEAGARQRAAELGGEVVYRAVGPWQPAGQPGTDSTATDARAIADGKPFRWDPAENCRCEGGGTRPHRYGTGPVCGAERKIDARRAELADVGRQWIAERDARSRDDIGTDTASGGAA